MAIHQERYQQHIRNPKAAVLLALLLGPIGMFYATMTWAVIMLFMNIVFGVVTYGLAILILWPLGARIAYKAVNARNHKLLRQSKDIEEQLPLPYDKRSVKLLRGMSGVVCAETAVAKMPPLLRKDGICLPGNKLIKFGRDVVRTTGTKCFSYWLSRWSSNREVSKIGSGLSTKKPSLSARPAQDPNEDDFNGFERRLSSLQNLKDKGLIDELEFRNKKKAILDEL